MASVIRSTRVFASQGMRLMQTRSYADVAPLKLTLAGANKIFYDKVDVKQVDVPSFSGDFGILATHVPTLGKAMPISRPDIYPNDTVTVSLFHDAAVLRPGVVTVYENDGSSKRVFVSSGTITVNVDSSVQVLAEEAHPIEDLDLRAAQEALAAAQSELSSAKDEQAKAEATLAVEIAESIVKVVQ